MNSSTNILNAALAVVSIIWPMVTVAEAVSSTAGKLSELIESNTYITELIVEGTLDASDLDYINSNLTSLKKIDLSKAQIEAYSGDRVLTGLTRYAANELPAYSLAGMAVEEVVLPKGLQTIGEGAFSTSKIASIELPETITTIGDYAFSGCDQLTSIALPQSVTMVGTGAFAGCTNLISADFSRTTVTIGDRTFDGCSSLSSMIMPNNLTKIGESAFRGTNSLAEMTFPLSLTEIGKSAFYGSGLESADLSKCGNLTAIGDFAFAECKRLKSFKLGGVPQLGSGVFFDDVALSEFVLPESLTVIPEFTFKGDVSLNSADILHDNVAEIGDYALTGWTQVAELNLPESLRHIGDNAMEGMTGLKEITATGIDAVPTLGNEVWKNVEQSDVILYVDEADADSYRSADQWNRFNVTVKTTDSAESVAADATDSGVEYRLNDNKLIITSKGSDIVSVEIYDLTGRCRYARAASSQVVAIDAAGFENSSVVVVITLADGTRTSLKAIF